MKVPTKFWCELAVLCVIHVVLMYLMPLDYFMAYSAGAAMVMAFWVLADRYPRREENP